MISWMRFFGNTILSSANSRQYLKRWRLSSLSSCVKEVLKYLGVLPIVFHPVVKSGVSGGDETSNDVWDQMDGSIELFRFSVFVHSTQDVCDDVRLPWDLVNVKIEFLKSVQPPDLAVGRLGHCLEILQCGSVGIDNYWQSVQIMSPFGGRFHECQ